MYKACIGVGKLKMASESSENVVMPDMSESGTNDTDGNENMISEDQKSNVPVQVTAVDVETVPVSTIPVGSLINVGTGETYNIVTSEHLQVRLFIFVSFFASNLKYIIFKSVINLYRLLLEVNSYALIIIVLLVTLKVEKLGIRLFKQK